MDKWEDSITGKGRVSTKALRWEHKCMVCPRNSKYGWSGPAERKQGTKTER